MARDIAQRDLDQAAFRIINLGDPKEKGDATKTDNTSVPKANAGQGTPGTSLLAAAADHVHPASSDAAARNEVLLDDPSQQSVSGTTEEVVSEFVVDFEELEGRQMSVHMTGLVKVSAGVGRFRVQVGGTPGKADGIEVLGFSTNSPDFEMAGASSNGVSKPRHGLTFVKIVAATDQANAVAHMRAKSVRFRGQP